MTRVLIIKTSSMGDIVHNLPVIADIRQAMPTAVIDWVVEEAYVDLVKLVRGVTRVLPVATRRWRHEPHRRRSHDERREFLAALRAERYDIVLDTQGLVKSAVIGWRARVTSGGARVGFAWGMVREGLARLFYDRAYDVDPRLHAIERMRALAAATFRYEVPRLPRFELDIPPQRFEWLDAAGEGDSTTRARYAVLLHATARAEKAWPAERWSALIATLGAAGITAVLPFGNAGERDAAESLVAGTVIREGAVRPLVPPPMTLVEVAALLAGADVVVGVDTGLLHLAAALDVPTVGLFGATPRWRYAPYWSPRSINLGSFGELGAQPSVGAVVEGLERLAILDAGSGAAVLSEEAASRQASGTRRGGPA